MRKAARRPRPVTAAWLERAALYHVERYPCSSAHLGRVLARKVDRRLAALEAEPGGDEVDTAALRAEAGDWITALVPRLERMGALDDERFAQAQAQRLRRRGGSTRQIRQTLRTRGVDGAVVDACLAAEREANVEAGDAADSDLAAASAFLRRRLRAPLTKETDAAVRTKLLDALARAGFDYSVARRALEVAEEGEDD